MEMQAKDTQPKDEQVVTPWDVEAADDSGIDYNKLIAQFGCSPIDEVLLKRIEEVIGREPHVFLRRGLFFSHRELDQILTAHEKGEPFYLYTGRGPSSEAMHLGHLIPFMLTKWLQDAFDVTLVIQITDDEKFLFRDDLQQEGTREMALDNIKDIIAMGFNPEKTFIFRNTDYIQNLYPTALEIMKRTTFNQVRGIFGFNGSSNIGQAMFPAIQAAPSFARAFPDLDKDKTLNVRCLIPCAIDQDPYFRMTRDVAPRMGCNKPALIHAKFIPALQGAKTKMSGSVMTSSIYMSDSPKDIKTKINKYAFSGGRNTVEEHRRLGADVDVDVSISYLTYFMNDDTEFAKLKDEYKTGKLLTGEVKKVLVDILQEVVGNHQRERRNVTDDMVKHFMDSKRATLEFKRVKR